MASAGQQQAVTEEFRIDNPAAIVGEIRAARGRARLRFRIVFFATWIVLVGGLATLIALSGRVHPDFIAEYTPLFLGGIPLTIGVALMSIIFAVGFAILGALGRISTTAPIYAVATLYVSLVRGTPLIVQIFFIYAALPQFGLVLPAFIAAVFALSFNYGAYMTEIFRAGIQAIPRGQVEAAGALGMTEAQTMRRVVLPQAIRIVIPAVGNEFIAMIKDSALVSYVGLHELFYLTRTVGSANFASFETLIFAAIVYWLLTIVFSVFQERLEKRMAESDRRL
jgi:polar amino acid transport system permease protein